jgi:hypothetical protein
MVEIGALEDRVKRLEQRTEGHEKAASNTRDLDVAQNAFSAALFWRDYYGSSVDFANRIREIVRALANGWETNPHSAKSHMARMLAQRFLNQSLEEALKD